MDSIPVERTSTIDDHIRNMKTEEGPYFAPKAYSL